MRKKKKATMTNKRLKPRTLGTKGLSNDDHNTKGLLNPAAAGGIGARRFGGGGSKAY
jgi:hypothetical protein